ncbi:MAG: radical SAM protein [Candidatus Moranbacteria bacterium]|nr:radical SAM protein [Candidatus Moranbacteria bacterium]
MAINKKNLDLLLVFPSLNWQFDRERRIAIRIEKDIPNQETPHIGMAYLLSIAKRAGLKVKYVDMVAQGFSREKLLDYIAETKPRLIGFTAFTIQIKAAGRIAAAIKNKFPGIKICVGGPHASAIPKETLREFPAFDFVVCGEGEMLLPKIFEALGNEKTLMKLKGIVTRKGGDVSWEPIKNLDDLPFPAWEEFDLSLYPGTYPHRTKLELPMITGRGCPYRCVFCCRSLGERCRHRSVASVIAEIEHDIKKFGCESIAFLDETFVANINWINDFLATFLRKKLNKKVSWSCSTRVSNVSPGLLKRMRKAGCYYIFYGIESADDKTLKRIKKNITIEQVKKVVRWTKKAGIIPVGAFIIGLPGDNKKNIEKDIELARELNLYSVTFPIAVPFPGTELRTMAERKEYGMKIISNNWDHYGKQDTDVMDSRELPSVKRKELQKVAYERHPKKNLANYIKNLNKARP